MKGKVVAGLDVYHWPEFQALMKRLGADLDEHFTKEITLRVGLTDPAEVTLVFHACDTKEND